MKKLFLLVVIVMVSVEVYSQVPQYFQYQAIARNLQGDILANQNISFRISILKDSINGTSVYSEIHNTATNTFGLSNLQIGGGLIVLGVFSAINWGDGPYFVKIEMDENGASNYQFMGVSQLLSVPYALYAEKVNPKSNFNHVFEGIAELDDNITWMASKYNSGMMWMTNYKRYSFLVPEDGVLRNLITSQDEGIIPAGGIVDITVLINGVATLLKVTYTELDGQIIKTNINDEVQVVKGDFVALRFRSIGAPLNPTPNVNFQAAVELHKN